MKYLLLTLIVLFTGCSEAKESATLTNRVIDSYYKDISYDVICLDGIEYYIHNTTHSERTQGLSIRINDETLLPRRCYAKD